MLSGKGLLSYYPKRNVIKKENTKENPEEAESLLIHAGFLKELFMFFARAFNGKLCQKKGLEVPVLYTVTFRNGKGRGSF